MNLVIVRITIELTYNIHKYTQYKLKYLRRKIKILTNIKISIQKLNILSKAFLINVLKWESYFSMNAKYVRLYYKFKIPLIASLIINLGIILNSTCGHYIYMYVYTISRNDLNIKRKVVNSLICICISIQPCLYV